MLVLYFLWTFSLFTFYRSVDQSALRVVKETFIFQTSPKDVDVMTWVYLQKDKVFSYLA